MLTWQCHLSKCEQVGVGTAVLSSEMGAGRCRHGPVVFQNTREVMTWQLGIVVVDPQLTFASGRILHGELRAVPS